jgi:hypothetical protein
MTMRRGRLFMAGALSVAALTLSSCNGGDEATPNVPASPASTAATPSDSPSPSESPSESASSQGGVSNAALDNVVSQGQKALNSMLTPQLKKVYSDIKLKADYPDGVIYTYVFRDQVPDGTSAQLDATSDSFKNIFTSTLVPALKGVGVEHPTATFTFKNPDGSVIWTHKFS